MTDKAPGGERIRTHWEDCEKSHHDCALAKLDALRAQLAAAEKEPDVQQGIIYDLDRLHAEALSRKLENLHEPYALAFSEQDWKVAFALIKAYPSLRAKLTIMRMERDGVSAELQGCNRANR